MTKKRRQLKKRQRILTTIMVMLFGVCVASAWATVSFVKTEQASQYTAQTADAGRAEEVIQPAKSHAPEPSTLALFGGGFLGMVISIVRQTYAAAKRAFDIVASTTIMMRPTA